VASASTAAIPTNIANRMIASTGCTRGLPRCPVLPLKTSQGPRPDCRSPWRRPRASSADLDRAGHAGVDFAVVGVVDALLAEGVQHDEIGVQLSIELPGRVLRVRIRSDRVRKRAEILPANPRPGGDGEVRLVEGLIVQGVDRDVRARRLAPVPVAAGVAAARDAERDPRASE